eukprot:3155464-Rhodomonas_salina.1
MSVPQAGTRTAGQHPLPAGPHLQASETQGLEMWSWWISGSASYVGQDGVVRIRAETVWWCVGPVSGEWMLCGLRSADMVDVGQVIDMVVSLPPSHTATHKVAPRPPQLEHLNFVKELEALDATIVAAIEKAKQAKTKRDFMQVGPDRRALRQHMANPKSAYRGNVRRAHTTQHKHTPDPKFNTHTHTHTHTHRQTHTASKRKTRHTCTVMRMAPCQAALDSPPPAEPPPSCCSPA